MHLVLAMLPLAAYLAANWAETRWNSRPAVRARWARLSRRDKITRSVRRLRIASAVHVTLLALWVVLWLAGAISGTGMIFGAMSSGISLATALYLLHHALATRRAYGRLGPRTYLAEVQHAFGGIPTGQNVPLTDRLAASMPEVFGSRPAGQDRPAPRTSRYLPRSPGEHGHHSDYE